MTKQPKSQPTVKTLVLNSMNAKAFARWYGDLAFFNLYQLQSAFGYSSAAGMLQGMEVEIFTVNVDAQGNVWPKI
jgi:hypothetical protein